MRNHIRTFHPDVYKEYLKEEEATSHAIAVGKANSLSSKSNTSSNSSSSTSRSQITEYFPKKSLPVLIDRENFLNGLIEMFTVEGRPFSMLEDPGFSKVISPILKAFNLTINRHNIADFIHQKYEEMKQNLIQLVENRLLCLKIDCASRNERSFLGINLQFVLDGKITVYTLSALELFSRHTGTNLKTAIIEELKKYNISSSQIYSVTSDSGANMLKTVKLLDEESRLKNQIESEFETNDWIDDEENEFLLDGSEDEALSNLVEKSNWTENFVTSKNDVFIL